MTPTQPYDDPWTFTVVPIEWGTHRVVMGSGPNPNDPLVFCDPWMNRGWTAPKTTGGASGGWWVTRRLVWTVAMGVVGLLLGLKGQDTDADVWWTVLAVIWAASIGSSLSLSSVIRTAIGPSRDVLSLAGSDVDLPCSVGMTR